MMARVLAVASVLLLLVLSSAGLHSANTVQRAPSQNSQAGAVTLPASLDALYPPKASSPVLLLAMHGLNTSLAGIAVDVSEDDRQGALANFESFRDRYEETARLVPEWASRYLSQPVEELGRVLASGTPEAVMAAMGNVGAVCHQCHLTTMVPVQQKYHWPDFGEIRIQDPIIKAELDYPSFMQMLNANLSGVGTDLEQGQMENARMQLAALQSRMATLKESCNDCHDSERAYYVDEQVEKLLAGMKEALDASDFDPALVAQMSRRLGEESCSRCHLVHLPAAYSGLASR